jgi:hypothetical protein
VKFAAKRTWPDHPKTWERQGEAESLEAFALAFASDAGMGVGTELMAVQKDADDPAIELFKVTAVDPYVLGPAQPRPAGPAAPQIAPQTASNTQATSVPDIPDEYKIDVTAVGATMWSLARPAMIMGAIVAVAILAIKFGREFM